MGPQGSGKSTQARLLADKLNMVLISTGTILRDLYAAGDPKGLKAEEYWAEGHLVPNELMHEILVRFLNEHPNAHGYVVEGFPREAGQYTEIERLFGKPATAVVDLTVDKEIYIQRIESRKVIEQRKDETPEAISRRLAAFQEHTQPLIDRFRQDGVPVILVDGVKPIEDVHHQIAHALAPVLHMKESDV